MGLNEYSKKCHEANAKWWLDLSKPCKHCTDGCVPVAVFGRILSGVCSICNGYGYLKLDNRNVGELLMLCVSELAEAMEGHRKNRADDHLPHRSMFEVELADCLIRIFDLAGGTGLDLEGAFNEKMEYNSKRKDHTIAHRLTDAGKKY